MIFYLVYMTRYLLKTNNISFRALWMVISLVSILSSCHLNSDFVNREKDKNDAEVVFAAFYQIQKSKDYETRYAAF